MIKSIKSIDLVLLKDRQLKYKVLSMAFSYPDDNFFSFFPELISRKEELISEYDRLFRSGGIWLYSTEYIIKNEFQRTNYLSDIMGFYTAFGLNPDADRSDSLHCEFEFMYYLIFKQIYAKDSKEKIYICLSAQKKFFTEYLYEGAKKIGETIISRTKDGFYKQISREMIEFLESEKILLESTK